MYNSTPSILLFFELHLPVLRSATLPIPQIEFRTTNSPHMNFSSHTPLPEFRLAPTEPPAIFHTASHTSAPQIGQKTVPVALKASSSTPRTLHCPQQRERATSSQLLAAPPSDRELPFTERSKTAGQLTSTGPPRRTQSCRSNLQIVQQPPFNFLDILANE